MNETVSKLEKARREIEAAIEELRQRNLAADREMETIRVKKRLLRTDELAHELESSGLNPNLAYDLLAAEVLTEVAEVLTELGEYL